MWMSPYNQSYVNYFTYLTAYFIGGLGVFRYFLPPGWNKENIQEEKRRQSGTRQWKSEDHTPPSVVYVCSEYLSGCFTVPREKELICDSNNSSREQLFKHGCLQVMCTFKRIIFTFPPKHFQLLLCLPPHRRVSVCPDVYHLSRLSHIMASLSNNKLIFHKYFSVPALIRQVESCEEEEEEACF